MKGQAEAVFAQSIVAYLDKALQDAAFDRLILVAAPAMLGLLRQKLSAPLQAVLLADLAKDLTHVTLDALPAHLADVIVV